MKTTTNVMGICCPQEVQKIQMLLQPLQGVHKVSVMVPSKAVIVLHDALSIQPSEIVNVLNDAKLDASLRVFGQVRSGKRWPNRYTLGSGFFLAIALFGYYYHPLRFVALAAIAVGIPPVLQGGLAAIPGFIIDINVLIILAVVGAIGLRDYIEGATIVFLFILAAWLESRSADKVQAVSSSNSFVGCDESAENVEINTVLAVKAGESIPIDGVVISGTSSVDESSLIGESVPVEMEVGKAVWAGTTNLTGYLSVKTVAKAYDSRVAKMVNLVEEAQNQQSHTEQVLQRFAKYYTLAKAVEHPSIASIVIGRSENCSVENNLAVAIVPLFKRSLNAHKYAYKALVLLPSACPCALIISTPVTTTCGLVNAARIGLLIKGGVILEAMGKLKAVADREAT
ncbi:hypothetical protein SUGI_0098920 [Cryptomeria japonica]|nr:hypothetical protein SUGI_0098920 [Cryptomeria japonica]